MVINLKEGHGPTYIVPTMGSILLNYHAGKRPWCDNNDIPTY